MTSPDAVRRRGAAELDAAGVDSPGADAATLLAHTLGTDPGRLLLIDDVSADDMRRFGEFVRRRAGREPLQHITGTAWFAGVELRVGPGVFVPRPETELIAEWAVAEARARGDRGRGVRVADLCSGSGALALAIADGVPDAEVVAVERSPAALNYLRSNVARASCGGRVQVIEGDVTDAAVIAEAVGECDVIVSNPPYVPAAATVSDEVRLDPPEAVFSGDSGMDVIAAMAPIVAESLVVGGAFAVEHDDQAADDVIAALSATGRFEHIVSHRDLAGRRRFVTAVASRARMER
ncbi:peptide chain release factor N(5)-glutamine methyltransferase [Gordonia zhaorongruii]|uniref:peptide chain release factor N(5)-glutamine methyltransferase n=1 Tax=Gordonia zhaorongruii TaxID=2597659 RepID=UPI00104FB544|nr:peptide chain release factor N(5)-glutamine methyltransferase [Gordonia zhaorongruii]